MIVVDLFNNVHSFHRLDPIHTKVAEHQLEGWIIKHDARLYGVATKQTGNKPRLFIAFARERQEDIVGKLMERFVWNSPPTFGSSAYRIAVDALFTARQYSMHQYGREGR